MSEHVNAAYHLVDRHVDSGDGGRTAVRSQGTSTSYAELQELSRAFAGGLRGLSVRRGDRVVFVCSDRLELAVGILGALRYGAVAVPLSTMLTGPELAKIVQDSGARVLAVTPEFGPAVTVAVAGATELEHVVVVNEAQVQVPTHLTVTPWSALLAAGGALGEPVAPIGADFPALWLYTSGTTGTPKGAMHRHANLRAVCDTYARDVLQVTPQDVFFSVAKIFFAYGIGNSLLFPLSVGATSVLASQRPSPQLVLSRLREDEPTLFFAGPTFYAALLAADLPDDTFRSVRLCASAGEALPASLYRRFTERFGVDVLDGIGSTEALHIFLSNRPGAVRAGTSGNVVPGYELQVRDEAGQLVPDGEPGALFVRGASMATGYWCRTDASREVFQGEWVRTGDTYVRSSDGYYTCLGRANDLLKAGGSGCRLPRSRSGCCSTPTSRRRPSSAWPTATSSTSRWPSWWRDQEPSSTGTSSSAGAVRGWRPSSARAPSWSCQSCPRRPPERCSASGCASRPAATCSTRLRDLRWRPGPRWRCSSARWPPARRRARPCPRPAVGGPRLGRLGAPVRRDRCAGAGLDARGHAPTGGA